MYRRRACRCRGHARSVERSGRSPRSGRRRSRRAAEMTLLSMWLSRWVALFERRRSASPGVRRAADGASRTSVPSGTKPMAVPKNVAESLRKDSERAGPDMPVLERGHYILDRADLGRSESTGASADRASYRQRHTRTAAAVASVWNRLAHLAVSTVRRRGRSHGRAEHQFLLDVAVHRVA
jgi:hypothetical protein